MILAYAHIAKAGGSTLIHQLRSHFGWRHIDVLYRGSPRDAFPVYRSGDLNKDLRICPGLVSMAGHALTPSEDFGDNESRLSWYTFVREPKSRSFSQYLQDLRVGAMPASTTFRAWMDEELLGRRNRNAQTKQLSASESAVEAISMIAAKNMFVGITEMYDDSLRLFSLLRDLQGLPLGYGSAKNVQASSKLRSEFSEREPDLESLLEEHNREDLKLYQYVVQEYWPQMVKRAGGEHTLNRTRLQALDAWGSKWRHAQNRLFRNVVYRPYCRMTAR